jgi:hypothetical protein
MPTMPPSRSRRPDPDEFAHLPGPNLPKPDVRGAAHNRLPALVAAIVVVVMLAGTVGFGVLMFRNPAAAATLRDIFLIVLGVQSMIIGLLLVALLVTMVYVALKVYDLIHSVQDNVQPILHRADDTVRTVHSRAVFVSDTAVKPIIEVMAYVSAAKSIIRSFTRSSR